MSKSPVLMFVAILVACSDGPTEPEIDLSGTWQFSGSFSNAELAVSCNGSGTVTIAQSGNNLSGTAIQEGTCNGPGGVVDNSGAGSLTGGQLTGSTVTFQWDECSYTGVVSGSPANRMTGSTSCTIALLGQNYLFTGQWQAGR